MLDISKIDKNFAVSAGTSTGEYMSVDEPPFKVYGLMRDDIGYMRIPKEVADSTSEAVKELYRHTAGGLVRFSTNSPAITIKAEGAYKCCMMPDMTAIGAFGFDVFEGELFHGSFQPTVTAKDDLNVEQRLYKGERNLPEWHDLTVYMPLYGAYKNVYIKPDDGYEIREGGSFRNEKPVVFYGSSITQGGCASTPGNAYTNMLSRYLNLYCVNLGFSGGARAEDSIVEYMSTLDMSAFVMDYDHNAPSAEYLGKTHRRLYEAVREKNPLLPIIIASAIPVYYDSWEGKERRKIICDTYEYALKNGDKNVYYLDGRDFFKEVPFDLCTVDGSHPNDMGMYMMYKGFRETLEKLFPSDKQ